MQENIPTKVSAPAKAQGCARSLKGAASGYDQPPNWGRTKHNRTEQNHPKTHGLPAVGPFPSEAALPLHPQPHRLQISAGLRNNRRRVRPGSFGFPKGQASGPGNAKAFRTRPLVNAVVTTGTKRGTGYGRNAVRVTGNFKAGQRDGLPVRCRSKLQHHDGYHYEPTTRAGRSGLKARVASYFLVKSKLIIFLLILGTLTGTAQTINQQPTGMSADGRKFKTPPLQDPFNPPKVNPYTGDPLQATHRAAITFDKTVEIPIPQQAIAIVRLKTPKGKPIEPEQIYLSHPEYFQVQVMNQSRHKTLLIRSTFSDPTALPGMPEDSTSKGVLQDGFAYVETERGTVVLKLSVLNQRRPENWEIVVNNWGAEAADKTGPAAGAEESDEAYTFEQFNYRLNPATVNPVQYPSDTPTERPVSGTNPTGTTDKESRSPEARAYNPYGPEGNTATTYYNPDNIRAPEITPELLSTAINMMRSYDDQRSQNVTTDNEIQRKRIGRRYQMSNGQEVFLAEAYRFPKYQSTALRIVWNNTTARAQMLNPEKVALKIGRFIHIPRVYGQVRNIVYPGQNNELYLVYRIPNADVEQAYELVLPKRTQDARYIEAQPLPPQP